MKFAHVALLGLVIVCPPLRGQIVSKAIDIVPRGSAEVPFTLTRSGRITVQVTAVESGVHAASTLRLLVSLESRTPSQPRWHTSDWASCAPPPVAREGGSDAVAKARHVAPVVGQQRPLRFMCAKLVGDVTPQVLAAAPNWVVLLKDETVDIQERLGVTVTISQAGGADKPD